MSLHKWFQSHCGALWHKLGRKQTTVFVRVCIKPFVSKHFAELLVFFQWPAWGIVLIFPFLLNKVLLTFIFKCYVRNTCSTKPIAAENVTFSGAFTRSITVGSPSICLAYNNVSVTTAPCMCANNTRAQLWDANFPGYARPKCEEPSVACGLTIKVTLVSSCHDAANQFGIPINKFQELNPGLERNNFKPDTQLSGSEISRHPPVSFWAKSTRARMQKCDYIASSNKMTTAVFEKLNPATDCTARLLDMAFLHLRHAWH
jgi:hypothetical protein